MTVFDNIAFPLQMRGGTPGQIRDAVGRVLDLVQLPGMDRRYPHQLSGGQQQRVAVARAIVFGPRVLLMDEPLGALDKNLREQLQQELRRLHRQLGITVVYVTHDQQEALVMSDRIAVMDRGRIVQVGTGKELYDQPNSVFVAQFLGESNLMTARVIGHDGRDVVISVDGLTLRAAGGPLPSPDETVWAFLRPERVRLAADGELGLSGVIEDTMFLGDALRCVIQLTPGPRFVAKFQPGDAPPAGATAVRVTWARDALRLLPRETPERSIAPIGGRTPAGTPAEPATKGGTKDEN
jgi:putative spermidine/putrescine transport system ATP-binding protein